MITVTGRWVGTLSLTLALSLSFSAQAQQSVHDAISRDAAARVAAVDAQGELMSRWRNYALASITPQFSWAIVPESASAPSVFDRAMGGSAVFGAMGDGSDGRFAISVAKGRVSDSPSTRTQSASEFLGAPSSGLQRTVLAPSYIVPLGESTEISVSAVLAFQRFASLGMGVLDGRSGAIPIAAMSGDTSFGSGVRIDMASALSERFGWRVSYQSRVNMDAFSRYRGVMADAGDFDIPGSSGLSINYALAPRFDVDVGVERIKYSDLTPFTSQALPRRFLALLGSGVSPAFAWRDLTVYSMGWILHDTALGNFDLRYTTRQQPSPTSALLRNVLADSMADNTISLGWSHATGPRSHMSLLASYASSPYFLGISTYGSEQDPTARQLELQGQWAVRF